MKTIIIDYGSGNLRSAHRAFERAAKDNKINSQILISDKPADIAAADHIVLPGVGAFKDCYDGLSARKGVMDALHEAVQVQKKPFLGICVGMQLMATEGIEYKGSQGLDWIKGQVRAITPNAEQDLGLKVPHMGWNLLAENIRGRSHKILDGIEMGLHAYFVHSYQFHTDDENETILTTQYGEKITAMVAKDNMVGTQFHPEKSQKLGLDFIANFLNWKP
ncbi:MAG: imidazole glycerol phosphate synthase subunit HisH [Alphaproteobacteria bacterium]|nr:imidazole glycerol phosphate synthase subunit HisH [Alphaproteobacteria bacterium]